MKHIVCFSGGKDSTALILWAKESLTEFTAVFCDTGWEHPITYAYVEEINQTALGGKLITLKSAKYAGGMRELVQIKGRVPSAKARFCTEELKVFPMLAWLKDIEDEVTLYQGIRAEESAARARMVKREWSDTYDAWVERPLLEWTAEMCFGKMKEHRIKPNPLYLLGAGRVGCFPCVLINQRELRALLHSCPEIKDRVVELEGISGTTFFPPNYIPPRFQTGFDAKSGKSIVWAKDVFRYIESVDEDQLPLLPQRSCMSVYNLCE
jgi:3'-phosphoadenosine 5'-phosphosulfate sulfotransferase (PAPS reductase)/FAD synthetase